MCAMFGCFKINCTVLGDELIFNMDHLHFQWVLCSIDCVLRALVWVSWFSPVEVCFPQVVSMGVGLSTVKFEMIIRVDVPDNCVSGVNHSSFEKLVEVTIEVVSKLNGSMYFSRHCSKVDGRLHHSGGAHSFGPICTLFFIHGWVS